MTLGAPFMIGQAEEAALSALRERADKEPVDMHGLTERVETPEGKRAHMDRMNAQTIEIPFGYMVTYSIETGHPGGTARHMSMSSPIAGRIPNAFALWHICERLGFTGGLSKCDVWIEDLQRGEGRAKAINVVQFI